MDLLGEQTPVVLFDADRDVPDERWNELPGCLQRFIEDPKKNILDGRVVCLIASVMPVFKAQLRENREFKETVHAFVTSETYAPFETIEFLPEGIFFLIFPEFLSELRFTHEQVTAELDRLDKLIDQEMEIAFLYQYVRLPQLFPQYQAEIKSRVEQKSQKIWRYVEYNQAEYSGMILPVLADALLLFPEKKEIIESRMRPLLGEQLQKIKRDWLGLCAGTIQELSIIFSEKAEIASDGTLEITPVKALHKPKELPGRQMI